MSQYGPPGGPSYPGQPQDPWQGGQPHDPYGQPADPYHAGYGQQDAWGSGATAPMPGAAPGSPGPYGAPSYQPGYAQPGYGPGDPWAPPPTPQRRRGGAGLWIAIVAVLAVLVCGGGAAGVYFLTKNSKSNATAGPSASATPSASASPSAGASSPSTEPSASASETARSQDTKTAAVGDCLVNRGTNQAPDMHKVTCAPGSYEVLKRLEGTVEYSKCVGTPNYTDYYYYDDSLDNSKDFVLCLHRR
jgi:hypothetical protein